MAVAVESRAQSCSSHRPESPYGSAPPVLAVCNMDYCDCHPRHCLGKCGVVDDGRGDVVDCGDCPPCGDGICQKREIVSCPSDCTTAGSGPTGSGSVGSSSGGVQGAGEAANQPPVANLGGPYSGLALEPIIFNGMRSTGNMESFAWSFGDGATATGPVVLHQFTPPGTYAVTLTVADTSGRASTASTHVPIAPGRYHRYGHPPYLTLEELVVDPAIGSISGLAALSILPPDSWIYSAALHVLITRGDGTVAYDSGPTLIGQSSFSMIFPKAVAGMWTLRADYYYQAKDASAAPSFRETGTTSLVVAAAAGTGGGYSAVPVIGIE